MAALPARLDALLADVDARLTTPFEPPWGRQPVHTAYVPADAVDAGIAAAWGAAALDLLHAHAATPEELGVDDEVHRRVVAKLEGEPVEDLRVDFEDGYGGRTDHDEDADAVRVGGLLNDVGTAGSGLRIKSFEPATRARSLRTLDRVLTTAGSVPGGFVVTLPKVSAPEQVVAMREVCAAYDETLPGEPLRFEVQVETPYAVARLADIAAAAGPRCVGLHYGTYDYSAAFGVAAAHQSLEHPVADHAKAVMQLVGATTGLRVVDGSSNVLPVGDRSAVRAAWALHRRLVERSLVQGIYQGWDLHPGQLVSRYAAVFTFYRAGLAAAGARLRAYLDRTAGGVLDEPATARALAGYLVRGLDCGALDEPEVESAAGTSRSDLAGLVG